MINTLKKFKPMLMIEVQDNYQEILKIIKDNNYLLFNENLDLIHNYCDLNMNTFCLHLHEHSKKINELGLSF
jgi:hypothetical protein